MTDVDIDFPDREAALSVIKHIRASRDNKGTMVSHNTGIYLQSIPHDPVTNLSTIDYKAAEERGYFKIDFLNVNMYKGVNSESHLIKLMETDPIWELLEQDEFTDLLFHVNGHGSILREMKPRTVEQLAAVLSMIRPAKRYLIGKDWTTVMNEVWTKPDNDEYYWKKSHSFSYAMAVIVHMNLICEQLADTT